jgi:hypothetical protein
LVFLLGAVVGLVASALRAIRFNSAVDLGSLLHAAAILLVGVLIEYVT